MSDDEPTGPRRAADKPDGGGSSRWSASSPGQDRPPTPVPPPALPPSDAGGSGRRYSADSLPDDWTSPLPRRSADSPSGTRERSPMSPPDAPRAESAVARRRVGVRLLTILGGVVVLGLIAAGAYLATHPAPAAPTVAPPTPNPVEGALLQPADLAPLGRTWAIAQTALDADEASPRPRCIASDAPEDPAPAGRSVRTFTAEGSPESALLESIRTYPDEASAKAAYATLAGQIGNCPDASIARGLAPTGLANSAVGLIAQRGQGATAEHHAIILARTGTAVAIVDASRVDGPFDPKAVATALGASLTRLCGPASGTCPATVNVASAAVPPPGDPAGWLAPGDLPQLTPGVGAWHATDVDQMRLPGTQCEGVDLTTVPGASKRSQRTFLLTDDPRAPQGFGVDQAIYTFGSEQAAQAFTSQVAGNMSGCAQRTTTATVKQTGSSPAPASGAMFLVDQKTNPTTSVRFRVAIVRRGADVTYLLANPSPAYDLADGVFAGLANRASDRLTQLP